MPEFVQIGTGERKVFNLSGHQQLTLPFRPQPNAIWDGVLYNGISKPHMTEWVRVDESREGQANNYRNEIARLKRDLSMAQQTLLTHYQGTT